MLILLNKNFSWNMAILISIALIGFLCQSLYQLNDQLTDCILTLFLFSAPCFCHPETKIPLYSPLKEGPFSHALFWLEWFHDFYWTRNSSVLVHVCIQSNFCGPKNSKTYVLLWLDKSLLTSFTNGNLIYAYKEW